MEKGTYTTVILFNFDCTLRTLMSGEITNAGQDT